MTFANKVEEVRQLMFGLMTELKGNGEPFDAAETQRLRLLGYTDDDMKFLKAATEFSNATDGLKFPD